MVSKWTFHLQGLSFRFHVKFRGCIWVSYPSTTPFFLEQDSKALNNLVEASMCKCTSGTSQTVARSELVRKLEKKTQSDKRSNGDWSQRRDGCLTSVTTWTSVYVQSWLIVQLMYIILNTSWHAYILGFLRGGVPRSAREWLLLQNPQH